jgi:hypothetical protein
MTLRKVGFFYRSHGDTGVPRLLLESRGTIPPALRALVVAYLRSGTVLGVSDGVQKDWFDRSKVAGKDDLLVDGIWLWPGHFAYYVETYGIAVPQEFLEHMASQSWVAKPVSADALDAFARSLGELGFTSGDQPPPGAVQWRKKS